MQRKIELPKLGDILTEDTDYILHRAEYQEQNLVALKIKGFRQDLFDQINVCKEKLSANNNSSVLKIIDVVSKGFKTIVLLENFSNISYELFAKNNMKLSQQDILNHAITLSASCASLVTEGYIPRVSYETICFDNDGALKLIHPHLIDTLYKMATEKSADYGLSKATDKIKLLFWAPEAFERRFQKNEASSVYQFGLFLLYSTLDNHDFINKSEGEIVQIAMTGTHPAIPAHCPEDIATVIKNCLNPIASKRPKFAEIRDKLVMLKTQQAQNATKTIHQEKDSLLSRIPKEVINNEVMEAIKAYGVFTLSDRSQSKALDTSNNISATPK